jgi:hypothetical protein
MGSSKTRKKGSENRSKQARHKRILYLPMARAAANDLTLHCRLALESIRQGRGDSQRAHCMAQAVFLTGQLTKAGHGHLDVAQIDDVEREVLNLLVHGRATGEWIFRDSLIATLTIVANEYDRLLCETRLQAVIEATDRIDRIIRKKLATSNG